MKVKELLSDESKWCKGAMARNPNGDAIPWSSKDAVRWCLVGAFAKCYGLSGGAPVERVGSILGEHGWVSIGVFNDWRSTTFADIRRVLELADV